MAQPEKKRPEWPKGYSQTLRDTVASTMSTDQLRQSADVLLAFSSAKRWSGTDRHQAMQKTFQRALEESPTIVKIFMSHAITSGWAGQDIHMVVEHLKGEAARPRVEAETRK